MAGEQGEQRDPTWITRPENVDAAAEGARLDGFVSATPPSPDFSEESGLRDPEIRATRLAQLAATKMGEANSYTIDDAKVLAVLALQAQMEVLTGVARSLSGEIREIRRRTDIPESPQQSRDRRLTFDQESDDLTRYCPEHGKRTRDGYGRGSGSEVCNATVRREQGIPILCGLVVSRINDTERLP